MANVDRLNEQLLNDVAFREDWKPLYRAFKHLFDIINQNRRRTGGDVDIVGTSQAQIEAEDSRKLPELRQLTKKVNALTDQIATIKAQQIEIKALKRRISELESVSNPKTELRKLQRRIDSLEMQVN